MNAPIDEMNRWALQYVQMYSTADCGGKKCVLYTQPNQFRMNRVKMRARIKKKKHRNLQSIKPKSLDCVCVGFICCANDDDLDIFNVLTALCIGTMRL